MPVTPARSIRLTDAEWAALEELGRAWGPVRPLYPPDVIRELIRRERENRSKTRAKPSPAPPRGKAQCAG